LEHKSNAVESISEMDGGTEIVERVVQAQKASYGIVVTEGGILIVDRDVQSKKTPVPMVVTEGGIMMAERGAVLESIVSYGCY